MAWLEHRKVNKSPRLGIDWISPFSIKRTSFFGFETCQIFCDWEFENPIAEFNRFSKAEHLVNLLNQAYNRGATDTLITQIENCNNVLIPIHSHGDHLTFDEFKTLFDCNGLDVAGSGVWSTVDKMGMVVVNINKFPNDRPNWATHVHWFPK